MSEHYTRGTESDTKWCNRCGRHTQHAVSGNRLGRCLEHTVPELTKAQKRRIAQAACIANQSQLPFTKQ